MRKLKIDEVISVDWLKDNNISFEIAYDLLQTIVNMQDTTILLEDTVKYYKVGQYLLRYCQDLINIAKLDIEILNKSYEDAEN